MCVKCAELQEYIRVLEGELREARTDLEIAENLLVECEERIEELELERGDYASNEYDYP